MPTQCENESDRRCEDRLTVLNAVFVVPWGNGRPPRDQMLYGITMDLSTHGMAVALSEQMTAKGELLIGFWCDGPMLVRGEVQRQAYIGGGFWQYGVQFHETVESHRIVGMEYIQECIHYLNPRNEVKYTEVDQDRRGACRMSADESARSGVLHVKGRDINAKILNESAGGFQVSIPRRRRVKIGQRLTLDTDRGCWQSEVIRCESTDKETRLGLKRLREVASTTGRENRLMRAILLLLVAAVIVLALMAFQ